MKLVTYYSDGLKIGIKADQGIVDITKGREYDNQFPQTINEIIAGGSTAIDKINSFINNQEEINYLSENELTFGPCVNAPGKIICVGLNYRKHAEETNMPIPSVPILFNKFGNTITGHNSEVLLPYNSEKVDYEAELVIVIGKQTKHVGKDEALDYVFGYCAANDLSARDLQFKTQQWLLGKSCDGFSPVGPYLVTADEVENPNDLAIKCYVNGEIRQNSNTADMIFYCNEIVSFISDHLTLEPGDIILTGTPSGVIMGFPEEKQVWLKDGDEVTIEIEKLGSLTNTMKKERL